MVEWKAGSCFHQVPHNNDIESQLCYARIDSGLHAVRGDESARAHLSLTSVRRFTHCHSAATRELSK
jgi:hypothetical protein